MLAARCRPRPRRDARRAAGAALAAVLGLAALTPARGQAGSALPVPPLRPAGRFLRDGAGRVVPVRGLFGKWKLPGLIARTDRGDGPTDRGNANSSFGPGDAELVAALGSTAFRLAWYWEALQPEPPGAPLRLAYLDRVQEIQRDLAAEGVFTILDAHQDLYGSRYGAPGFPDWATVDDGVPQPVSLGFPANYLLPATSHAFDSLWLNRRGILDRFAAIWEVVAARFSREPYLLGYDLMNEPWPGLLYPTCAHLLGCPHFDLGLLQPAMERLARAVHRADPDGLALLEPHLLFNVGVPSYLGLTYGSRPPPGVAPAGISYHDQCLTRAVIGPLAPTAPGPAVLLNELARPLCDVSDELVVRRGLALGERVGGPAIMTELQPTFHDDVGALECMIERAEANMASYTYGLSWSPRGSTTELREMFEPLPPPGDPRRAEVATARAKAMVLARTAPLAIAGTPRGWAFDPRTGLGVLRFVPHGPGPTSIFVPARQYPQGYEVQVRGGILAGRDPVPGGVALSVEARPGAREVEVRVTRPPGSPPPPDLPALPPC